MDYSSPADVPVPKAFDNVIENDHKGNFMVKTSAICFNHCVPKITESALNQIEVDCLKDCYVKSYYSSALDSFNTNL
jgi:hypothetical protein